MSRPWLRYAGRLGADLEFEPELGWETHTVAQAPVEGDGLFVVEALDASGQVLMDVSPAVRFRAPASGGTPSAQVVAYLPLLPGLRRLRLRRRDYVIHRRDVAEHPPTVHDVVAQLTPARTLLVSWRAEPGTGATAALAYRVVWVAEGRGAFPLSGDLHVPMLELPVARVPGSPRGRVAVLASDGVRSGFALSTPVAVPSRAARLVITEPRAGSLVPHGQAVTVRGGAFDDAGRRLEDAGLAWMLDGQPLASDTRLTVASKLSPGEHQLVLVWEGVGAPRAEARVLFRVEAPPREELPPSPEVLEAPVPAAEASGSRPLRIKL